MEWFGLTDKGKVRATNQDIYRIKVREDGDTALIVVCDGMGGANAGNVASRFASEAFINTIEPGLDGELDEEARRELLLNGLQEANDTVYTLAGRQPEFRGMGTTLVAALIKGDKATILNVGDSRAYILRADAMEQISLDHSYVEEMRRMGRLTKQDARRHPHKNLITRAVGVEPEVRGDLFEVELKEDHVLMLCTDGLTGMAEDEQIEQAVRQAKTLALAGDALLNLAVEGGGRDNITVALFRRGSGEGA